MQPALCLQHQEDGRFPKCWKALNGMLLRMASTNAFTSCKALKLCVPGETMHNWQWCLMQYIFPAQKIEVQAKHLPIRPSEVHACAVGAAHRRTNAKLVAFRCTLIALRRPISRAEGRSYGMGGSAPLRSSRHKAEPTTPNAATPRRLWLGMEGIGIWHKQTHTCKHTNTRAPHTRAHTNAHTL